MEMSEEEESQNENVIGKEREGDGGDYAQPTSERLEG